MFGARERCRFGDLPEAGRHVAKDPVCGIYVDEINAALEAQVGRWARAIPRMKSSERLKSPQADEAAMSSQKGQPLELPSSYKKILVGYDGSKNSGRALARAAVIAKEHAGSLRIAVVVNSNMLAIAPMAPPLPSEVFDDMLKNGKQILSEAMVSSGELVPGVTGSVEEGNPAERILHIAADEAIDLIVVGRRGISGVERFLLGGVSSSIVAHSKCDVLVVR